MTTYAYLRVSTDQQDVANQRYGLFVYANTHGLGPLQFVEDTASGRLAWRDRAVGRLLTEMVHAGDAVLFAEISRMARSTLQVLEMLEYCRRQGVSVHIAKQQLVLDGHPKLSNDLRRPAMEEIGSRATVFLLDGVKGQQRAYMTWPLEQCTTTQGREDILTDAAPTLLADRLTTPLQIEHYLTHAFEEGHKIGQKPLTPELIESVLARDLDDLEPRLTRHGYNVKGPACLLRVRPTDIRGFLAGQLPPSRTQELQQEILAAVLPV